DPTHAGGARGAHAHPSADLRRGVGRGRGQSPAVPAGAHHQSAAQDRGACRPARARRHGAGRRLSRRAAGVTRVAGSRVRAWLWWIGVFVVVTVLLRACRDGLDTAHAVLTYLLVMLGGSVSGGRPWGSPSPAPGCCRSISSSSSRT